MNKEQFLMVPYTILYNKELNDGDKLTLSLVYSYHNAGKDCTISNSKLGEMFGISRNAASERITKLAKLGYVQLISKTNNMKTHRRIVPIKMVAEPNNLVGKDGKVVGEDGMVVGQDGKVVGEDGNLLVGEVGTITLSSLLDYELKEVLHYVSHYSITLEQIENQFNNWDVLSNEKRNLLLQIKYNLKPKKEYGRTTTTN